MSDPLSAASAFVGAKLSALLWSLGAALATLSFTDETRINLNRSLLRGFLNLLATWFIGFTVGEAVNHELQRPEWSGVVYVISTSMGLLVIGGLYKLAHTFRHQPEEFLQRWLKFWRK